MEMVGHNSRLRAIGTLLAVVSLVAAACSNSPGGSAAASGGASAPAASAAGSAAGSAAAGTKHVAILNQDMTDDQIKAAIAKEGTVTVGNWTYAATAELVNQFQLYVKATYGADIKLNYVGTQSPSEYITKLAAAAKTSGTPAPYDVIAVEENYWYDASQQGLVADSLTSDLIPNQSMVMDVFKHAPQSIAFQSTAYPGIVYNKDKAPYLKSLKDLANPALKGRLRCPSRATSPPVASSSVSRPSWARITRIRTR